MKRKIIIIGGVAGGASAAARLRRLDEEAEIIILERDGYISFANCGLPYYIGETITDRNKLLLQSPERMKERFNIDVRIHSEAIAINTDRNSVTIHSKDRGAYEESYDSLILSPGAKPIKPAIPGIDNSRIHTLRNMADTDRMKQKVDQKLRSAVVVGGGFIGIEMAENLRERGMQVTLVEAAPHILAPFDSDIIPLAEKELRDHGVQLIVNNGVRAFEEKHEAIVVHLQDGQQLHTELVVFAVGVAPDTAFLANSGIILGARGHIIVNERMQTNIANVYAVGDAIEVVDYTHKGQTAIPLAGPANKQGRIAADQICGFPSTYKGTQGTAIVKVFDLTCASTGLNERSLQRMDIPYYAIHLHPASHAGYYPGAQQMSIKLLFRQDNGAILGAQAIGREGTDKRIDVIATAARMGATVDDLAELELAYAPPYSSAKDPVNMAGFIAQNVLHGLCEVFTVQQLAQFDPDQAVLIDVRTSAEHQLGHIPGSIHIPLDELRSRLNELPANKELWVYCQVGQRGYLASRILAQKGYRVKNLTGGYRSYTIANL